MSTNKPLFTWSKNQYFKVIFHLLTCWDVFLTKLGKVELMRQIIKHLDSHFSLKNTQRRETFKSQHDISAEFWTAQ